MANKSQRREMDSSRALGIAIQALDRIEMHEKECGARWSEAVSEIKSLRTASDANSARWEKLAWTVIGTVIATALPSILHLSGVF